MPKNLIHFSSAIVAAVEPDTTALEVAQLMRRHHVGALVLAGATMNTTRRARPRVRAAAISHWRPAVVLNPACGK